MEIWQIITLAILVEYALVAVWFVFQALECSHGKVGWREDLRIALEAAGWLIIHLPWREWFSMSITSAKHSLSTLVITA